MFEGFRKKKKSPSEQIIEIFVGVPIYEQLTNRAIRDGISENAELQRSFNKGMNDLWLHVAKYENERYKIVEQLYEQSKRDNSLLEALFMQNMHFREILENQLEEQTKSGSKQ